MNLKVKTTWTFSRDDTGIYYGWKKALVNRNVAWQQHKFTFY